MSFKGVLRNDSAKGVVQRIDTEIWKTRKKRPRVDQGGGEVCLLGMEMRFEMRGGWGVYLKKAKD